MSWWRSWRRRTIRPHSESIRSCRTCLLAGPAPVVMAAGRERVEKVVMASTVAAAEDSEEAWAVARGGGGPGGGGPGGGAGRMTLTEFCQSRGIDPAEAQSRLEAAGMRVTEGDTVRDIAVENGFNRPFEIIEIIEGRAKK